MLDGRAISVEKLNELTASAQPQGQCTRGCFLFVHIKSTLFFFVTPSAR